MTLWLSKPLYLLIPYFYAGAGLAFLAAAIYLDYWYWPLISLVAGLVCFTGAAVIWWKRRR